tara:strand:+ start:612 stop:1262 length:651 start_codon:yes stop_codon:yes gene_type:complete
MRSFGEYDIDQVIYGHPSVRDAKIMQADTPDFALDPKKVDIDPPHDNSSPETKAELEEVRRAMDTSDNMDFHRFDAMFSDDFAQYCKDFKLPISYKRIKDLSHQVAVFVHTLKYKFNRPRPEQLSPFHQTGITTPVSVSGRTPAYPSGHASQSRFIARYIGHRFPDYAEGAMVLADRIAQSRIDGGVHYPSDNKAGQELADLLFQDYLNNRKGIAQ